MTFVFDSVGQPTTMEDVTGVTTSTYDSISRKTTVINPDNKIITYTYNVDGQLTSLVNPQNDRTTYAYDAQGRRESVLLANGTRTSFVYDANSQTTNVVHRKSDNSVINSFAYNYDALGNRTSITEANADRTTYTYDVTNQLASEHRSGSQAHRTTFTYDDSGNRIKKEKDAILTRFEYDVANQMTVQIDAAGRTTYTFDSAGNQQVILEPNNDLTTTTWNYENQPILYEKPTNALVTMTYNSDNRRVSKESTSSKTNFIWDLESDNVLLETDDFDTTQVIYTNEPNTFGSLISQRRGSTTSWYHFDALGSTNNLTNSNETITDSYIYDAWGNKLSTTGSTTNPFQYVGQYGYYHDEETGSNYIRARVYSPIIGRWASADPLGFVDGMNLYLAYFVPNRSDPSGLAATDKGFEDSMKIPTAIKDKTMIKEKTIHGKTFSASNCMGTDDCGATEGCKANFKFVKAYKGRRLYVQGKQFVRGVYVKISANIDDRSKCACDILAFVQIARTITKDKGKIISAKPGSDARIERGGWKNKDSPSRGWYIDVESFNKNVYWGTNYKNFDGNNGSQPAPPKKASPTELWDAPGEWLTDKNLGAEFVTCAMCYNPKEAKKTKVLACVRWGYYINNKKEVSFEPTPPTAMCRAPQEFEDAVKRWNKIKGNTPFKVDDLG